LKEHIVKDTPKGWPRISSSIFYQDAAAAIDWLCRAFGFEVRLKVEGDGGRIEHSELTYGDGLIMVGNEGPAPGRPHLDLLRSPKTLGGQATHTLMVYVDDVDAHVARARAAGAIISSDPTVHDYGKDHWADKSYGAIDLEGHQWWFSQRMRGPQS
jgi:uncharacterized glyoxalase superfamily protein PhnB